MDHTDYPSSLAVVSKELEQLKRKFYQRCSERRCVVGKEVLRPSIGDVYVPRGDAAAEEAVVELQRVVASALLDASTTMPEHVDSLHEKLLIGQGAARYRELLRSVGHPDVSRAVYRLSEPDAGCLSVVAVALNGRHSMYISAIHRRVLADFTGAHDPMGQVAAMAAQGPGEGAMLPVLGAMLPGGLPLPPLPLMLPGGGFGAEDGVFAGEGAGGPPIKRQRLNSDHRERGEQLLELLDKPTAMEAQRLEQFKSSGPAIREHCPHLTKGDCRRASGSDAACHRLHFRRIIHPWTDVARGNCPFLDTCRNVRGCRYVHYERDDADDEGGGRGAPAHVAALKPRAAVPKYLQALSEPQWVNCDVRTFDMAILGKFGVVMADPPWEINQDLPYGTMSDQEMRGLNMACLQDDGVMFLWVTSRAMELGRECLELWGYERCDELVWVKTNQLQRLTGRTGRTGHWLNHSKEHCLIGIKGRPQLNRHVDCDVVMAEVRETSRKPDEMYALLERLSPGTRKLEIFARNHNLRPGWVSLGNQLQGSRIMDPELQQRYVTRYGALPADAH